MRSYDPLSVDELGRNAARTLMEYPADVLPPHESFVGVGVYTLHYIGAFPAYTGLDEDAPIYVGKADPPGRRQGRTSATSGTAALYRRLSHHAESIRSATNLDLADFRCRWLVLDPVWIGLTEQVLISQYRPIWNVVLTGFGNNPPGQGRQDQQRSRWDTMHPGRESAFQLRDRQESVDDLITVIASHRNPRAIRPET